MIENSARSSARTGGPEVRLPSVSYWPPWHGQPKPAIEMAGTSDTSRNREAFAGSSGPFGCTGQPRWAQWFEMIVKLGWSFSWPLYRMNAVRLDTVPWDASAVYD